MKSLYVIGDSISIQYGPFLENMLKGFMSYSRKEGVEEAMHDLDIPVGANGGTSMQVREFLESKSSDDFNPDYLLLNCGLHDIKRDVSTREILVNETSYRENLERIVDLFSRKTTRLVWCRTTPVDSEIHRSRSSTWIRLEEDVVRYNQIADEVMSSNDIPIIDLYTHTLNLSEAIEKYTRKLGHESELYIDHVHFHITIREKQAAFIAGWFQHEITNQFH